MLSIPLHPALVHLPLGLAFVMPLLALALAFRLWTGRSARGGWTLAVALQALLLAGGLAAMKSGQAEEERVEKIVAKAAIHQHEEYAEGFLWAAGFALIAIVAVRALHEGRAARALSALAVVGALLVAGLALQVGHAGGQLVYLHGAAAAYTGVAGRTAPAAGITEQAGEHERDEH